MIDSTSHPEWMGATLDAMLRSAGLPPEALACLDEDDQGSLAASLRTAATEALMNGQDVTKTLKRNLTGWLQDWTETNVRDLVTLVGLAWTMCSEQDQRKEPQEPALEEVVDWVKEGF